MTTTQQYALVLLHESYIAIPCTYSTAQLYAIYTANKSAVDAIYNSAQLDPILSEMEQYLPSITITDPNAVWG